MLEALSSLFNISGGAGGLSFNPSTTATSDAKSGQVQFGNVIISKGSSLWIGAALALIGIVYVMRRK
jgi:hypothetical protein